MRGELNPRVTAVTERIAARSAADREVYLAKVDAARLAGPRRATLSCGNLAHGSRRC